MSAYPNNHRKLAMQFNYQKKLLSINSQNNAHLSPLAIYCTKLRVLNQVPPPSRDYTTIRKCI